MIHNQIKTTIGCLSVSGLLLLRSLVSFQLKVFVGLSVSHSVLNLDNRSVNESRYFNPKSSYFCMVNAKHCTIITFIFLLFHTACLSHSTSRSDSWRFRFGFSFISTRSLQIVDLEDKNNLKEY